MKLTPVYNIHPGGDVISDYVPQSGGISHPLAVRAGYGGRVSPLRGRPENQSGLTLRGVGGAEGEGAGLRHGRGLSCRGHRSLPGGRHGRGLRCPQGSLCSSQKANGVGVNSWNENIAESRRWKTVEFDISMRNSGLCLV